MLHDQAIMMAMVGENNWGQAYEGTPPKGDDSYRVTSKPLLDWLEDMRRAMLGLPPIDRQKAEKKARKAGLLRALGLTKGD